MTTHANVAAVTGLPRPPQTISFVGDGDYRLRTATGWLEAYCDAEWPDDRHGPSIAVWSSRADALAGNGPMCRVTRSWFLEIAIEVIGERETVRA